MGGTCLWVIGIICSLADLELRFSVPLVGCAKRDHGLAIVELGT